MALTKEVVLDEIKDSHGVVLNILPEEAFHKLHIRGSRSVPMTPDQNAFAQTVERRFGKERFLIIYGSDISSRTAVDAFEILRKKGFRTEIYLGGMKEWAEAGFPTEGTEALKKAVLK